MRCETCDGRGFVTSKQPHLRPTDPCPDCGGTSIAHCCDGIVACPILDAEEEQGGSAISR